MGEGEPLVTELALTVRSTDMDADRNVNNAVFFTYFEQSRLEHLLRLGLIAWPPAADAAPEFALVHTEASFRRPARHRDLLLVRTRTLAIGTRSFRLGYEVFRPTDAALVCEGESTQVWLDAAGGSTPLPERVRAALDESLLGG